VADEPDPLMATAEEIAEVERRYGKTIEELVVEAERGYDLPVSHRGTVVPPGLHARIIIDITLDEEGRKIATPSRIMGCGRTDAAEALRAVADLLSRPPGPVIYETGDDHE
jgi:hypothetical protein